MKFIGFGLNGVTGYKITLSLLSLRCLSMVVSMMSVCMGAWDKVIICLVFSISLLQNYLISSQSLVLINGSLTDECQFMGAWDSVIIYLVLCFIIAMEGLYVARDNVVLCDIFRCVSLRDGGLHVFHLFYINDFFYVCLGQGQCS